MRLLRRFPGRGAHRQPWPHPAPRLFWLASTVPVNPGTVSQLGIWRIIGFERSGDKGIPKQRDWTNGLLFCLC